MPLLLSAHHLPEDEHHRLRERVDNKLQARPVQHVPLGYHRGGSSRVARRRK